MKTLAQTKKQASIDRVLEQIEIAKNEAIAFNQKMPSKRDICSTAAVSNDFFRQNGLHNRLALITYDRAAAEVRLVMPKQKRTYKTAKRSTEEALLTIKPTVDKSKPSPETQLLGHLRWRKVPIKTISRLLNIHKDEVQPLIDKLLEKKLIVVHHSAFAKDDKDDEISLANQQQKAG
ncbi:hypothetical protein H6F86_21210 [Phormidium sp. FACHB-592]|uniref:MarR family transcriptional regulator n=1 Tax=Stenomitos frigidus AS-A4 TaxID=2933935 RepID=A0ABV0KET4_9CYAN|nr:hypothetical protein [Phormidium sp. FACHB-592]MBD2076355.1 hypothetical protein [Phormidium sp. FACHB-592]